MKGILCALAIALAAPAAAEPVYTLLSGADSEATTRFVDDLTRLWQGSDSDHGSVLSSSVAGSGPAQLQALRRMQADFAIIDADTLARRKAEYPDIAAVTLLWPEALHLLTKRQDTAAFLGIPAGDLLVANFAVYGQVALTGAFGAASPGTRWLLLPRGGTPSGLQRSPLPLLLTSGVAPLPEVEQAMRSASDLRLLSIPRPASEQIRARSPWLSTLSIPANLYPGQTQPVETLAVSQVLVARADSPPALVQHALAALFRWQERMAASSPRFAAIDRKANAAAATWFPFHSVAMKEFGIAAPTASTQ